MADLTNFAGVAKPPAVSTHGFYNFRQGCLATTVSSIRLVKETLSTSLTSSRHCYFLPNCLVMQCDSLILLSFSPSSSMFQWAINHGLSSSISPDIEWVRNDRFRLWAAVGSSRLIRLGPISLLRSTSMPFRWVEMMGLGAFWGGLRSLCWEPTSSSQSPPHSKTSPNQLRQQYPLVSPCDME